jgi:hypothetical protein
MQVKYFTLEQANRTLPLVRRIVTDIVHEYRQWKEHVFRYELVAAGSNAQRGESDEQIELRRKVDASAERINAFVEELAAIGCLFKGFDEGLVDFQARVDGRDVLLCWKLGEDSIEYWHELEAGFAGRQPLTPDPSPAAEG